MYEKKVVKMKDKMKNRVWKEEQGKLKEGDEEQGK